MSEKGEEAKRMINPLKQKDKISIIDIFLETIKLIIKHPSLIIWSLFSALITGVLFVLLIATAFYFNEYLMILLEEMIDSSWVSILQWIIRIVLVIIIPVITYFAFTTVGILISIPILDIISEKTEKIITGENSVDFSFFKIVLAGLKSSVLFTIKKIFILIISLPLLLIPFLGWIIFFLINSNFATFEFLDITMARKGWEYKYKKAFIKKNISFSERILFGAVIYGLLLIPFLNLFVYPIATIAGTIYFLRINSMKINHAK